jgi:hypothetical protein
MSGRSDAGTNRLNSLIESGNISLKPLYLSGRPRQCPVLCITHVTVGRTKWSSISSAGSWSGSYLYMFRLVSNRACWSQQPSPAPMQRSREPSAFADDQRTWPVKV